MSLMAMFKGWLGETQSAVANALFLDDKIYTSINNVTIPTRNGTTQIDHVIVSRFGLFVVETKNMKGWIFGDERDKQWTVSVFGRKHRFQNPLHQNYRHTMALSEFLGVDHDKLHSVVMFWGDAELKTPMPANVMTHGYASYIKSKQTVEFSDPEVIQLVEALRTGMLPKTWATRTAHIHSLKERHSSLTTCPKCGSPLVQRTAKSGPNTGRPFLGCSGYPKCRHTAAVPAD
jgi:restriction system protein